MANAALVWVGTSKQGGQLEKEREEAFNYKDFTLSWAKSWMMQDTSASRLLSEKDRIEILKRVVPEFPITRLIRR
ncbi:hypothetical protein HO173_010503 [Letharia columbiana]|uniref:Uncharacterized protein n=1 Tax=Letharia columbiana TaxID=112416 RepID=A0A8H6L0U7_9LECA|nr:uncharacterized protein HO173_010503 [Letharia columbiana]KAF6231360.1 hypothetical protein HO173_010503 [Letharia columbiana]